MPEYREYRNGPMDGYVEEVPESDTDFSSGYVYPPSWPDADGNRSRLHIAYGYRETKFNSDDDYRHFFEYLGSGSSEDEASLLLSKWMKTSEHRQGVKAWRKRVAKRG